MYLCLTDKALKILKSASSQANSFLTETHPLHGELADATARAYATTGENNSLICHMCLTLRNKIANILTLGVQQLVTGTSEYLIYF